MSACPLCGAEHCCDCYTEPKCAACQSKSVDEIARIAGNLTKAQREDLIRLGDPGNPFGGLFDALSAADLQTLKNELKLVSCHFPAGCMAPLTKLNPRGRALRRHLLETNGHD